MDNVRYKILNPYKDVDRLLEKKECHYKTNLHAHTTYSDAYVSLKNMIIEFYEQNFDIAAISDHGVLGVPWNRSPAFIPLYFYQFFSKGKREHLTDEEFKQVENGTYRTSENRRTKQRGMMCVPDAIEANMLTIAKNHVNGYFTDKSCQGRCGRENDFRIPVEKIEKSGGLSHINHPTDWLRVRKHPENVKSPDNIKYFADILKKYRSCLGIEVFNNRDFQSCGDRILWDELLKVIIPQGRNIWGFSNSDAHYLDHIDTSFMDFILPECSLQNLRTAMEKGCFFAVSRFARNELGDDFRGEGKYPFVTGIEVDETKAMIEIRGSCCNKIQWIADGEVIKSDEFLDSVNNKSTIFLREYADKISCYVRVQLSGPGGICLTQPFICDDGNMKRFICNYKADTTEEKKIKPKKKIF